MREVGLFDRFILTGMVPPNELASYVGAMDILAHPSRREGIGTGIAAGAIGRKTRGDIRH